MKRFFIILSGLFFLLTSAVYAGEEAVVPSVSPAMIIPFILLLLSIAVLPFINKHWWEKNYPVVAVALALIPIVYYVFVLHNTERMLNTGSEYISFIILIGSLFVVAGGILIRIKGKSTPLTNLFFLAIGAVVSNFLGTTGASMIMIRPYLRVNKYRLKPYHVVFFIFIVSNMGGALTPIGDPPLFLGYLKGVPFFWVLEEVWHIWAFAVTAVLAVFFLVDYLSYRKYEAGRGRHTEEEIEESEVSGMHNIFFLTMILVAVFIQHPLFVREAIMVLAAVGSYYTTKKEVHKKNDFNFIPVKEVAILFLGIFATMVPALDWLEMNAASIGVTTVGQFYWGTGILSGVLDNAPTYLNSLSASIGLFVSPEIIPQVQQLVVSQGNGISQITGVHAEEIRATFATLMKYHADLVASGNVPIDDIKVCYIIANHAVYLKAISIAAVFFGAMTYIGNGPNFMVKSIAEQAGAKCPSFGGYIVKYSLPILIPIFALVWWVFFRG